MAALLATPVAALAPEGEEPLRRKARMRRHIERLEQFAGRLQKALNAVVSELQVLGGIEAPELTAELARRKAELDRIGTEAQTRWAAIEAEASRRLREVGELEKEAYAELERKLAEVEQAEARLVETRESVLLQEVGIYEYTHPLDDAVGYKAKLEALKGEYETLVRDKLAITSITGWRVNGSAAQGRKMVNETSKLMLRAYNAEADNLVRTMKPFRLESSISRLEKTRETISRLGSTMQIQITAKYHRLRVKELKLTADYLAKMVEEKERAREERARLREEHKAQLMMARERERLEKERNQLQIAVSNATASGETETARDLTVKLDEVEAAFADVAAREANVRAGFVYVISNLGSFGPDMVKIGMTRRLEPMERVHELGDSSVPFRFDVHAIIYSDDARGLEARLHDAFDEYRVNQVNLRREFFYVAPAQVRAELENLVGEHLLKYTEEPQAYEWRQSGGGSRITRPSKGSG